MITFFPTFFFKKKMPGRLKCTFHSNIFVYAVEEIIPTHVDPLLPLVLLYNEILFTQSIPK